MSSDLREVAGLFLKLGFIAFGGPAAHIAMMRDEVVTRRKWLDDQDFLDMVGATSLIPGPNSTEMVIHLSHRRAGWSGFVTGGLLFILPAAAIVLAAAVAYVEYSTTDLGEWVLYGIKPVLIAIVLQALWGLGGTAVKGVTTVVVGGMALGLYLLGVNEIILVFGGGALAVVAHGGVRVVAGRFASILVAPMLAPLPAAATVPGYSLLTLFLNFLKIGSVLYGSGYVLLAFLRGDFVDRLGWLTDQQLIDAVAIGQFTPGPVFTTATFVGYLVGSWSGAVVATIGIFVPSFVFVALLSRILPLVRRSELAGVALDGVNVASLGLMAGVTWQLARSSIVDPFTAVLGLVALAVMMRVGLNSAWLVAGGAVAGVGYQLAFG